MATLHSIPTELFEIIIEHLVVMIGIYKAAILRTVDKAFDSAIIHTICTSQVVSTDDSTTADLVGEVSPMFKGKILAKWARSANSTSKSYLLAVKRVIETLDGMLEDDKQHEWRHEAIAQAVYLRNTNDPIDAVSGTRLNIQNLLSGAIIAGELALVKQLLDRGDSSGTLANVHGRTPYFDNPLILAAAGGHISMVQYLLDRGVRPYSVMTATSKWHDHPLATHQDLCRRKLPVKWKSYRGIHTALREAVRGGHTDVVHLLLQPQHRPPPDSPDYVAAILSGASVGRADLIRTLLETIGRVLADFPGLAVAMLELAAQHNRIEVVRMLLDSGVHVDAANDADGRKHIGALHAAAALGHLELVRFLLDRGADVNILEPGKHETLPIEVAASHGQEEVIDLLLKHGARPADSLVHAASGGQHRVVRYLLAKFPHLVEEDGGMHGHMAFYKACTSGNLTVLSILVEAGVLFDDGNVDPTALILPMDTLQNFGMPWVTKHLLVLGARSVGPNDDEHTVHTRYSARSVLLSERTWEWVSKY